MLPSADPTFAVPREAHSCRGPPRQRLTADPQHEEECDAEAGCGAVPARLLKDQGDGKTDCDEQLQNQEVEQGYDALRHDVGRAGQLTRIGRFDPTSLVSATSLHTLVPRSLSG